MTPRNLPPLSTLRVFYIASRSLSFTKAADDLCLSRSAVSRQIKNLEDHFGFKLFERHNVSLQLTKQGVIYANAISNIFADLKVATDKLQHGHEELKLKLGISVTFNSTWLISRLHLLEQRQPNLAISFYTNSFDTLDNSVDFSGEKMDAAIRLGTGNWLGCKNDKLVDVYVQLVCAPSLLDSTHDRNDINTLLKYNWLHYSHLEDLWDQWLQKAGYAGDRTSKREISFDNVAVAVQAAVDGLGIIPMYRPLADPLLKEGKLVVANEFMMRKNESYYFVCPSNYKDNESISIFRDWIIEEAGNSQIKWDIENGTAT